jgi:hypothetical protein
VPSFIPDFIPNLTRLSFIALLLAVAFVVAARFRHFWGTTPIAVLVGLLQVPQTVLAISLSVGVFPGVSVSPGSVIFFPATLFAILLVYVLEDEAETRRLIYGILIANLTLAVLIFIGQPLFDLPSGVNSLAEAALWTFSPGRLRNRCGWSFLMTRSSRFAPLICTISLRSSALIVRV